MKRSNTMNQSRVNIEEKFQTEFALWRSGSSVYEGGNPQPREQAVLHLNKRPGALATVGMPRGFEFLVDPPDASRDIDIQKVVYKVQILSPQNLGERLRERLQECMKELRNAQDLAQVLEALAMFCSHHLQLSDPGDEDDDHPNYETGQTMHPQREFQEKVSNQVLYAANACQISAEVVAEIAKLGASMLTGDEDLCDTTYLNNPAPAEPIKEVLVKDKDSKMLPNSTVLVGQQEIASLCQSANEKAVLEGNALQWRLIQIMIEVGAFMEGDLALSTIGISFNCAIIVEIAINELDFSRTVVASSYRVSAYQGPRETQGTGPSIALTYFIPHVVKQYVTKEVGTEHKEWLDQWFLIGLMKHIVYSLMFLKYNCVSCGDRHMDLRDGSFFRPHPCRKNLCIALFDGWMKVIQRR